MVRRGAISKEMKYSLKEIIEQELNHHCFDSVDVEFFSSEDFPEENIVSWARWELYNNIDKAAHIIVWESGGLDLNIIETKGPDYPTTYRRYVDIVEIEELLQELRNFLDVFFGYVEEQTPRTD